MTSKLPVFRKDKLATVNPRFSSLQEEKWCLFEDHVFNANTKTWEPADVYNNGYRKCLHSKCIRKHKAPDRPAEVCSRENDCPDAGISCFLLHDNTKLKPLCRWGENCVDKDCTKYRHPNSRVVEECPDEKCPDALITCFKLHSMSKLVPLCHYKENCTNYMCSKRHSGSRKPLCDEGSSCWYFITGGSDACDKLHPKILQKACRWDTDTGSCRSYECPFVHRPGAPADCPAGLQCPNQIAKDDTRCMLKHPRFDRVTELPDGSLHFE